MFQKGNRGKRRLETLCNAKKKNQHPAEHLTTNSVNWQKVSDMIVYRKIIPERQVLPAVKMGEGFTTL